MSMEYAQSRIKEALHLANGNQARARQQVIAWTFEDAKLLQALTKHHLTGIVAYHIERVASGRSARPSEPISIPVSESMPTPAAVAKAPAAQSAPKKTSAPKPEAFGMEILKAVASSDAAVFGLESYSSPQKRGKASQRHINALKHIAAKSQNKPIKRP